MMIVSLVLFCAVQCLFLATVHSLDPMPPPPSFCLTDEDKKLKFVKEPCKSDQECFSYYHGSTSCNKGVCSCNVGFTEQSAGGSPPRAVCDFMPSYLYQPCTNVCAKPLVCDWSFPPPAQSEPAVGKMKASAPQQQPVPPLQQSKYCTCRPPYTEQNGYCFKVCPRGTKYHEKTGECRKLCKANEMQDENGVCKKAASLGEPCENKRQCAVPYSDCQSGKCACAAGTKQNQGACVAAKITCPFGSPITDRRGAAVACTIKKKNPAGRVKRLTPVPPSLPGGGGSWWYPSPNPSDFTDTCGTGQFCLVTSGVGDIREGATGHCCAKPKPTCPVGDPHPTATCWSYGPYGGAGVPGPSRGLSAGPVGGAGAGAGAVAGGSGGILGPCGFQPAPSPGVPTPFGGGPPGPSGGAGLSGPVGVGGAGAGGGPPGPSGGGAAFGDNGSPPCPHDTHSCHTVSYNGISTSVCCPLACAFGQVQVKGRCYQQLDFGDQCSVNEQCAGHNGVCVKGKCDCTAAFDIVDQGAGRKRCVVKCKPGQLQIGDAECVTPQKLGDPCQPQGPNVCPQFAFCHDRTQKCTCLCGFIKLDATTCGPEPRCSGHPLPDGTKPAFCKVPGNEKASLASAAAKCQKGQYCANYMDSAGLCCPIPAKPTCPDAPAGPPCDPSKPSDCGPNGYCYRFMDPAGVTDPRTSSVCCIFAAPAPAPAPAPAQLRQAGKAAG